MAAEGEAGDVLDALFDFSFTNFVTAKVIKVLYGLGILVGGILALVVLAAALSQGGMAALGALLLVPLIFLLSVMYLRVVLEVLIVVFRIAESTSEIAATLAPPSCWRMRSGLRQVAVWASPHITPLRWFHRLAGSLRGKGRFVGCGVACILAYLLIACGGGGGPERPSPPPPPPPSFSLSVAPSTSQSSPLLVRIGTSGSSITVTIQGRGGFSGSVDLRVTGLPSGVSASPNSWSLTPGQSQVVVFSATSAAASGSFQASIEGTSRLLSSTAQLFGTVDSFVAGDIGPEGGTISVTNEDSPLFGIQLHIPPGALSQTAHIGINPAEATPPVPNRVPVGPSVELRPPGLIFNTVVSLRIPYKDSDRDGLIDDPDNNGMEPEFLQVYSFESTSQSWLSAPNTADLQHRVLRVELRHFSIYRTFYGRYPSNSTITYAFDQLPTNRASGVTDGAVKEAIRRAWRSWESELARSGISVTEVSLSASPDVTFRWTDAPLIFTNPLLNWLTGADPVAFTNPLTSRPRIDILFYDSLKFKNDDGSFTTFVWTDDLNQTGGTFNIEAVTVHEIGHVLLGTGHPCSCSQLAPPPRFPKAVMNATADPDQPLVVLQRRDRQAYRDAYGLIYAVSGTPPGSGPSSLYLIDPISNGTDSFLGVITLSDGSQPVITDIALLPRGFTIFTFEGDECCFLFGVSFDRLFIIDTQTGAAESAGSGLGISGVNALTFDLNARLFGATTDGALITIDIPTGMATQLGLFGSGFTSSGDLGFFGFFGLGPLYATVRDPLISNDLLVKVDSQTGTASRVDFDTNLGFQFVFGLAFSTTHPQFLSPFNRSMFGLTARGDLIEINPSRGTASRVRRLSFSAFGGASLKRN